MSSEALERAAREAIELQARLNEGDVLISDLVEVSARDVLALLAEVARLEQERDEAWHRAGTIDSQRMATEAALAVACEREQRLRIALQDAQGIALNGTDRADSNPERLLAIDAVVTAALVDEPAAATLAGPEARTRGGEEVPHERAASSVCGPQDASGSASAAADEPGETP